MALGRRHHSGAMAPTTLNGNISAGATSLVLTAATNAPSTPFGIKIDAGTASEEKIIVGSLSGTTASSLTRGADGTTGASHSSGAAVEHDFFADEADEANDHINTTTRDDHTQYARTDGTRAFSGGVTVTTGGLTVSAGGAAITGAVTASSTSQATAQIATLTGTNGRYVGSTSGVPSGTYSTGDFANDPAAGFFWLCTSGGSPGTWVPVGGGHASASAYLNGAATLTSSAVVPFDTTDWDPLSMYSASTHKFTVPYAGIYSVSATVTSNTTTSSAAILQIQKNSTLYEGAVHTNGSSAQNISASITRDVKCAASDTLAIFWATGPNGAADPGIGVTWATVRYVGPA